MINLLNSGFTRLKKSKIFWVLIVFSIFLALFVISTSYSDMKKYESVIEVEQLIINYSTIIGIAISIFTSIFLGVEYSDGAIRNKISIGHKRVNIYLSNLIITTITSLLAYIVWIVVIATIGIPLFGEITMPVLSLLMLLGCILVAIIAYSSIFTFIAMMISNKTITAIVSIMLAFGFMIFALTCMKVLETPEYIQEASVVEGDMKFEEVLNPKYPSENKKKVFQALLDVNPSGQMFQIAGRGNANLKILPLYSLGILVVFTSAGIMLFNKKEIK